MTSKKIIIDAYNTNLAFSDNVSETELNQIIKDLEDYEELKKIMGTPIQEIMKRLKILDILKRKIKVYPNGVIYLEDMPYEECIKIKEWLNGKD